MNPTRIVVGLLVLTPLVVAADEFDFDVSAFEKKPVEVGGFVEGQAQYLRLSQDSAGYELNYFDRRDMDGAERYGGTIELNAVWRRDPLRASMRAHSELIDDETGTRRKTRLYEGFLQWLAGPQLTADAGKKSFAWGKGYAWNPVAFLERPKDASDPELSREGFIGATAELVRSKLGPLQTFAVTAATLPVSDDMNADFGEAGHSNPAVKIYTLLGDTDIDFLALSSGSRSSRYGVDFSRNLGSQLEIHGEWARVTDVRQTLLDDDGTSFSHTRDVSLYLFGLRFLSAAETTIIAEYYYNGGGYTSDEMERYLSLVHAAAAGDDGLRLAQLRAVGGDGFLRPYSMRRYGYLRISQKEPRNIVYLTTAFSAIVNIDDGSYAATPEVIYTGLRDIELRARVSYNAGDRLSEYGEKQGDLRGEIRARYYF